MTMLVPLEMQDLHDSSSVLHQKLLACIVKVCLEASHDRNVGAEDEYNNVIANRESGYHWPLPSL